LSNLGKRDYGVKWQLAFVQLPPKSSNVRYNVLGAVSADHCAPECWFSISLFFIGKKEREREDDNVIGLFFSFFQTCFSDVFFNLVLLFYVPFFLGFLVLCAFPSESSFGDGVCCALFSPFVLFLFVLFGFVGKTFSSWAVFS